MERVLIIGSSGAGKTTLATSLGRQLRLPVIHLDREYWQPGWAAPDAAAWQAKIVRLCEGRRWIMDGDFCRTLLPRLEACDTVIFLDISRWICLRRVLWRSLRYFGRSRPDLQPGCHERLPRLHLLRRIWRYSRHRRPQLLGRLGGLEKKRIIILDTPEKVRAFVGSLAADPPAPVPRPLRACPVAARATEKGAPSAARPPRLTIPVL